MNEPLRHRLHTAFVNLCRGDYVTMLKTSLMGSACFALVACGGGGGSDSTGSNSQLGDSTVTPVASDASTSYRLSGHVTAGAASCNLSLVDANGSRIASAASDADGAYALSFDSAAISVARLEASNCVYEDEMSGERVFGANLAALIALNGQDAQRVQQITPFTSVVARRAVADGKPLRDVSINDLRTLSSDLSESLFGDTRVLNGVQPAVSTLPASSDAEDDAIAYGLLLSAVSAMGDLDTAVDYLSGVEIDSLEARERLANAAAAFELSGRNKTGRVATLALAAMETPGVDGLLKISPNGDLPTNFTFATGTSRRIDLTSYFVTDDGATVRNIYAFGIPSGMRLNDDFSIVGTPNRVGRYNVLATAYTNRGAASINFVINVRGQNAPVSTESDNEAPIVVIADGVRSGDVPFAATFSASGSRDTDGTIERYDWDFGDSTVARGFEVEHTYDVAGTYQVTLTATDDDGAKTTRSVNVTAEASTPPTSGGNQAPIVVIADGNRSGQAPFTATLSASGSRDTDGSIQRYDWDFGDGNTARGFEVDHTYREPGNYTARLTATDDDGATSSVQTTIRAIAAEPQPEQNVPPIVVIADGNRSGQAPFTATLSASGSRDTDGSIQRYDWDFGDGDTARGFEVDHRYTEPGDYTVRLTATDDDGATSSQSTQIMVRAASTPDPTPTPPPPPAPTPTPPSTPTGGAGAVELPIEVLGDDGFVREVRFDLADASGVDTLWVQCSRCGYRDGSVNPRAKGSVKLNDGPWVDMDEDTATVQGLEARMGGINGGFMTSRFTVPISGARAGSNTLRFRFNGTDGHTNGYRIVAMNLLKNGSQPQLQNRDFVFDNPASWSAFSTAQTHLSLGEDLWNGSVPLSESPISDHKILASCADCHATDGRDLKYFNYSNESIVARARFHGLSTAQGEAIASYIREGDGPAPATARPWNPPYQPGPGLDDRPVEEWAAGAGLDAVLESDEEMLPFLFPNGTSRSALLDVMDSESTLNIREMPVAVQFPDWKAWLPEVHPKDVWPNDFSTSEPMNRFNASFRDLETTPSAQMNVNRLKTVLADINWSVRQYLQRGRTDTTNGGSAWRTTTGAQMDSRDLRYTAEDARRSLASWSAVKQWELAHRSGLADEAARVYPAGQEARAWLGNGQSVHQMAPHITSENINNWSFQGAAVGDYLSSAWYQLQMTLNPGQRQAAHITPVDWPYQLRHIFETGDRYRSAREPLRLTQSLIKAYQSADNGMGTGWNGWQLRFTSPVWLYAMDVGSDTRFRHRDTWTVLDSYETGLHNSISSALLTSWLDVATEFDVDADWARVDNRGDACTRTNTNTIHLWYCVAPKNVAPRETRNGADYDFRVSFRPHHADHIYELIPMFRQQGVDSAVMDRFAEWGERMWPAGDWENR